MELLVSCSTIPTAPEVKQSPSSYRSPLISPDEIVRDPRPGEWEIEREVVKENYGNTPRGVLSATTI